MFKKIVIAADSFKGSITSGRFAEVCRQAIAGILPDCEVVKIPLGDGGEGTVDALTEAWGGDLRRVTVSDPLMRPVEAVYGISADGSTAIMEMARASGLPLLDDYERNPMLTTTRGTGEMIADALRQGCSKILIGIGGSASNDGGMGMLGALGATFLDAGGKAVDGPGRGCDLSRVASIDLSGLDPLVAQAGITVACDVDSPFCGPLGAARVFAGQKGADSAMVDALDLGMAYYSKALTRARGIDIRDMPGAGAAGGLGGALAAALGAKLMPGIDMVLEAVDFDRRIAGADLIITGEGRIDCQTLMGKTPFGVLSAARRRHIPVVALGGSVEYSEALNRAGFAGVFSIQSSPISLCEALDPETACRNLENTVTELVRLMNLH